MILFHQPSSSYSTPLPCGYSVPPDSRDYYSTFVKKYTDVQELNAEIIREFVEKIYIYKTERIGSKKVQKIKIVWNCIGDFMPPVKGKTA